MADALRIRQSSIFAAVVEDVFRGAGIIDEDADAYLAVADRARQWATDCAKPDVCAIRQ